MGNSKPHKREGSRAVKGKVFPREYEIPHGIRAFKGGQGDGGNAGYPMAAPVANARGTSHHVQPFTCEKTGNVEHGWVGETEAGRVWGLAELLTRSFPAGCATGCCPSC